MAAHIVPVMIMDVPVNNFLALITTAGYDPTEADCALILNFVDGTGDQWHLNTTIILQSSIFCNMMKYQEILNFRFGVPGFFIGLCSFQDTAPYVRPALLIRLHGELISLWLDFIGTSPHFALDNSCL